MAPVRSLLLIALVALCLAGCTESISSPGHASKMEIEKNLILELKRPDGKGITYRTYKTIKDATIATEIKYILMQSEESNAIVSMSRAPDRKIALINASLTASSEPRNYGIWFSPQSNPVEVVSESSGGGYVQLNKENSDRIRALLK